MTQPIQTYDKSDWGAGPWQEEPDGGAWLTQSGLLGCFIRNPRTGNLNGYVAVLPGHPYYGRDYSDIGDLTVWGGLTFAGRIDDRGDRPYFAEIVIDIDERLWWLGFDCGHWNDYEPRSAVLDRAAGIKGPNQPSEYKTVAFVKAEVEALANQLAKEAVADAV